MPAPVPLRERGDACPGVFAPHDAADGALARVRLPGGAISTAGLRAVADCAEDLGDGRVHLTSRGNLQLRGLSRGPELAGRLAAAGLLPSATHERVRNVLASPLSGIASERAAGARPLRASTVAPATGDRPLRASTVAPTAVMTRSGGSCDVRTLAPALDRGLCARPGLAALPGRFLFALDDGRGDVAAEEPDLCWRAVSASSGVLLVAGVAVAEVDAAGAVPVLLDAAEAFLVLREADGRTAWRAAELSDAPARIAAVLGGRGAGLRPVPQGDPAPVGPQQGHLAATPGIPSATAPLAGAPGPVRRDDGGLALVVAPLLGELTADQVRLLADAAERPEPRRAGREEGRDPAGGPLDGGCPAAVVTPWRTVVLPDPVLSVEDLARAGLLVGPGPDAEVSACAGRPGCAKALADVRGDVRAALARRPTGPLPAAAPGADPPPRRVHVSGCDRRCGAPRAAHVDVVATARGYLVDGVPRPGPLP